MYSCVCIEVYCKFKTPPSRAVVQTLTPQGLRYYPQQAPEGLRKTTTINQDSHSISHIQIGFPEYETGVISLTL